MMALSWSDDLSADERADLGDRRYHEHREQDLFSGDVACYDIIAQDKQWDEQVGPGSYCVHVARIAGGKRSRPNLDVAKERAEEMLALDVKAGAVGRYFEIHSAGRVAATVRPKKDPDELAQRRARRDDGDSFAAFMYGTAVALTRASGLGLVPDTDPPSAA